MLKTKRFFQKYFVESVLVGVLIILCLVSYIFASSIDMKEEKKEDYIYVTKEILTDNVKATISEDKTTATYTRPYKDESVKIVKNFYDYEDTNNQENAIIYYENTYIQNTGVDYAGDKTFEVLAVADGTVMQVTNDDIVGTTIKIQHNDGSVSVYQSVSNVTVQENDKVSKNEVIAKSGTNTMSSDLKDHLHFELYINNALVNPEKYFTAKEN